MRLSELINGTCATGDPTLAVLAARGALDLDIVGLTADSRAVKPGYLFAALPGVLRDGRCFIADAVARGAVAVLTPEAEAEAEADTGSDTDKNICVIPDPNPRRRLARIAAKFYQQQPAFIAAITGTNGKTSVAEFLRQIWALDGVRGASLGTLGLVEEGVPADPDLTTPDPVRLHARLADLAGRGVEHLALEASSHGLDQHRLDGVRVRVAIFTNLSQDHLDYHASMAAYLAAKLRLFAEILDPGGTAIVNRDAPDYDAIASACRARGISVMSYGQAGAADLRIAELRAGPEGAVLTLTYGGESVSATVPLVGAFQAMNAVAALCAAALSEGCSPLEKAPHLARLTGVAGRLQRVGAHPTGAPVYVDYAHTPDALRTVLTALRPHVSGALSCVFGAGGERDRAKRKPMGEAVAEGAEHAIVTDDNPRMEDPAAIRRAVLTGCPEAREIGDRAAAIRAGIEGLTHGDALVIAGKGHEPGQTIGADTLPFDDRAVARAVLAELGGSAA